MPIILALPMSRSDSGIHDGSSDSGAVAAADRKAPSTRRSWFSIPQWELCIAMHIFLVGSYLILVIVWRWHLERRVPISQEKSATAILSLSVSAQVIGTIVTAILLMLTQQQAIRRDLHGQPTLAAIHDKSSAWLGLGSSVVALSLQFRMRSAAWQIVFITVYLSGIFALHITTPNLFSLAELPHGAEQTTEYMVSRGMPDPNNTPPNQTFPTSLYTVLGVLPYLPLLSRTSLVGLSLIGGNYGFSGPASVVSDNPTVDQSTSIYPVCYSMPDAKQVNYVDNDQSPAWVIEISTGWTVTIPMLGEGIALAETPKGPEDDLLPSVIVVASSADILDDNNIAAPRITVNPVVQTISTPNATVSDTITLVACNIWTSLDNLTVNLESLGGYIYNPFVWHAWEPSSRSIDPVAWMTNVSDIPPAAGFGPKCVEINDMQQTPNPASDIICTPITLLDQYLIINMLDGGATAKGTTLQNTLGNSIASVAWNFINANWDSDGLNNPLPTVTLKSATVTSMTVLNINGLPVLLGLAVSIVMSIAAFLLIRKPPRSSRLHPALNTLGVLQLVWLMGKDPRIASQVVRDAKKPTLNNLWKAGNFEVNFAGVDTAEASQVELYNLHHASTYKLEDITEGGNLLYGEQ